MLRMSANGQSTLESQRSFFQTELDDHIKITETSREENTDSNEKADQ